MKKIGEYKIIEKIGKGAFSKVYKAVHESTDDIVAIKVIPKGKLNKKLLKFMEELRSKDLDHDNVIKLIDIYITNNSIYMILEYCSGKSLDYYIKEKELSIYKKKMIIRQIIEGAKYCDDRYIIHRDIKPDNILFVEDISEFTDIDFSIYDDIVKIIDFDFAKILKPFDMTSTICGSPLYMAPEIIKGNKYNSKADIWSIGVIVYQMLVGEVPYRESNLIQILSRIYKTELEFPEDIDKDAKDFIKSTLSVTPYLRPSYNELLEHPFLRKENEMKKNKETRYELSKPINIKKSIIQRVQVDSLNDTPISLNKFRKRGKVYDIDDSIIQLDNNPFLIEVSDTKVETLVSLSYSHQFNNNDYTKLVDILNKGTMVKEIADYKENNNRLEESLVLNINVCNITKNAVEYITKLKVNETSKENIKNTCKNIFDIFSESKEKSNYLNGKVSFALLDSDYESIIYEYIIDNLCKGAVELEINKEYTNALRLYTKAGKYMYYLSMDKGLKNVDIKMINYYLVIISEQIKRLNEKV